MNVIEARRLWKEYGDNIVLENINVSVKEGEFITIVGASGCGKTTFLKLLLGIEQPSRGDILLDGKPFPAEPSPDRGIVFQRYSTFPHLNVLQNVMLGAELAESPFSGRSFGKGRAKIKAEAIAMLKSVGLEHTLDKYPNELSGGMQQRLALAQALIKKPRILLLDEPFGALDPGIRSDMHNLALDIWKETGLNIFMITHDLAEGFHLGTRLWVFDKRRYDEQAPNRYGAAITYDIPLGHTDRETLETIEDSLGDKT
ncbi:ABC transporter ATP-binding protein [Leucothrix sargassi]|nr:ABC transporter ATP-binding protein [Leucothrix sargassi]